MFSSRLQWELRPNRLSRLLAARRQAGVEVLDLTESNPTRARFAYPAEEIREALADPRALLYDPQPAGAAEARAAIAMHWGLAPERVVLTASTSESYSWLFKLLANPGDEVLVPRPSYPLFEFLAALESVRAVPYHLVYHGAWSIDFETLRGALTDRTRAVVVVNPNNPTGSFLKLPELEELVALAGARNLALISDEVFAAYAFAPDARRASTLAGVQQALAFCLGGLSKYGGLPQMKAGWIVTGGPEKVRQPAMERLELIADTYLSVGTPVQCALPRLLAAGVKVQQQIAARTSENVAWLRSQAGAHPPAQLLEVEGGWYATVRVPRTRTEEGWCLELLEHENVLVQPGYFYDFEAEAFLILSLLTPPGVFREGVGRLLAQL